VYDFVLVPEEAWNMLERWEYAEGSQKITRRGWDSKNLKPKVEVRRRAEHFCCLACTSTACTTLVFPE